MAKGPEQLENKIKEFIRSELKNTSLAEDFKVGGGFLKFMKEGAKIYENNAEAFKSTGLLLEELAGPNGLARKFADLAEGGVEIFGGIENTSKALGDLTQNMRSFSMNQPDMQRHLTTTLAVFKELGASVTDFTGIIDGARLGFKMSGDEAINLANSIGQIGMATGVGMGEAMKNFRSAQMTMAYSSGKLMENFRSLQITSAQTGVGFEKLTSAFGESMDSFETSATKAGSLNAILGRSVFNSIDLLGKTEAQRVETIIQGIRKNVNMSALGKNKFQLKAIATGLGLSPEETRKLLIGQMTVDEALSKKESKDPREKALAKMGQLLKENVNPGLEYFTSIIDRMRTRKDTAEVAGSFAIRESLKKVFAAAGLKDATPADLFIDLEELATGLAAANSLDALNTLKAQTAELGKQIKGILTGDKTALDKAPTAIKNIFDEINKLRKQAKPVAPQRGTVDEDSRSQALIGSDIADAAIKALNNTLIDLRKHLGVDDPTGNNNPNDPSNPNNNSVSWIMYLDEAGRKLMSGIMNPKINNKPGGG